MFERVLTKGSTVGTLLLFSCTVLLAQSNSGINPYPETPEEIAAYKQHLIKKYHEDISDYPEESTEISTLEELFEYAGRSGVHVRMKPGLYQIDVDHIDELWQEGAALLRFDGENSFYDLRGVEIRIDSYLNHTRAFTQELVIKGKRQIIQGLHITMVGNYGVMREDDYNWGQTVTAAGKNNLTKGIRIISRGTYPYGYGHALMFEGVNKNKKGAVGANGQNSVYIDWKIYNRSMGHALSLGEDADQTWIDCHIEGQLRLGKDILEETAGGFYENMDNLPEKARDVMKNELNPEEMYTLGEDAFRSYGGGNELKILGGTMKEVRSAVFRGDYERLFVSNVRFTRLGGALFGIRDSVGEARVVDTHIDATCRQLFRLWGGSGRELKLYLRPPNTKDLSRFRPKKNRSAIVDGEGHKILLKAGDGLNVETVREKMETYPIHVKGKNHVIRNETGLPVKLLEGSRNCRVITNGDVTDNGKKNNVKRLD